MTTATPEFSRPIRAQDIPVQGGVYEIEAAAEERAALARRFDLQEIGRLKATVRLQRVHGGRLIRLAAQIEAEVVQSCAVTLEPVPARISHAFELLFDPAVADGGREVVLDPGAADVEPLEGDSIDIGEAVAEELALSLDPYPRAPGAAVESEWSTETGNRPFEVLARLKRSH